MIDVLKEPHEKLKLNDTRITTAYSSMVEPPAHNGEVSGSSPDRQTKPLCRMKITHTRGGTKR